MLEQKLKFRPAVKDDIDFLFKLRGITMSEHLKTVGSVVDDLVMLERVQYKFEDAKIVMFDKIDIGLLKINKSDSPWEIIQIQILPQYQGNGIGKELIKTVLSEAKLHEVDVILSVLKGNPAKNLYERLGFLIYDEVEIAFKMRWCNN